MKRSAPLLVPAAAGVALALATAALVTLLSGNPIPRHFAMVAGVPIEVFAPDDAGSAQPARAGVVVVHGFSGNRQLMYGFGFALARSGYVAALVDFAGHGASLDRLPGEFDEARYQKLAANLATAIEYLQSDWGIPRERIAILGHSMGASVVTRYAVEHPDVPATVAISLGEFGARLPAQPDQPRNLLILVGAAEFAGFLNGSANALRAAWPDGVAGQTYGDFAQGSARRLVIVPGVEHITILFSPDTYREAAQWIDLAFNGQMDGAGAAVDGRMGLVLLLYLAAIIGFYPLARMVWSGVPTPAAEALRQPVPGRRAILTILVAAVLAPPAMLVIPYRWMPLNVGNYAGVFFLIAGAVLWIAIALDRSLLRRQRQPASLPPAGAGGASLRALLAALTLAAYALLTFGLTAHLTWTSFALVGERLWMALVLFVFMLVYFWADETLIWRPSARARLGLYALSRTVLLVSLVVAILLFGGPFFLLILLPVMLALFVWHGVYAHWLHRLTGRPWVAAVLNAAVFAWMIAATFPVVS
ncbi:MAG: alpha/beta hydrolase [Candidatus Roseilinea sp.]|uniref:alpha/beta hydrolase n=1 Tax=Candidatus Roseilinea sp. TaxID=2838777 RepID=UPI00404B7435